VLSQAAIFAVQRAFRLEIRLKIWQLLHAVILAAIARSAAVATTKTTTTTGLRPLLVVITCHLPSFKQRQLC